MKKVMVGVAVALALVTSNAAADGIESGPPPSIAAPMPVYAPTWSGFYIGAGIGGGAVVHDFSLRDDFGSIINFDGIGGDGVFGTAILGWDWQIAPRGVLGAFVDYDFSDISTDVSLFEGEMRGSLDHDHSWSVGARLGWLATPGTLLYATGGYTEARFDTSMGFDNGLDFDGLTRDRTFSGFFVGGGIDTRLALTNWFLRLEYRFSDFSSERIFHADFEDGSFIKADVEPSMHTARLTLTYKFKTGPGWGGWGAGPDWGAGPGGY